MKTTIVGAAVLAALAVSANAQTAPTDLSNFTVIECENCDRFSERWRAEANANWRKNQWHPAHGVAISNTKGPVVTIAGSRFGYRELNRLVLNPFMFEYNKANQTLRLSDRQLPVHPYIKQNNGNSSNTLLFSDFDGDGRDDLYVEGAGMDERPFPGNQGHVYLNKESGWVPAPGKNTKVNFHHSAALIDLDMDGKEDILNAIACWSGWCQYNTSFSFKDGQLVEDKNMFVDSRIEMHDVEAGDLNGDGIKDIVFSTWSRRGRYMIRNADGSWQDPVNLPSQREDRGVGKPSIADINGDGLADIVLRFTPHNSSDTYKSCSFQVLIQKPSGKFIDQTDELLVPLKGMDWYGECGLKWRVADFNGDGYADLVIEPSERKWDTRGAWLRVFWGNGKQLVETNLFAEPRIGNHRIQWADFDGNGKLDMFLWTNKRAFIMLQN
jgi:hypothetical protein